MNSSTQGMKKLITNKLSKIDPLLIEGFILDNYGIKTNVVIKDNLPMIKTYNHLSLFSIIKKIRLNFSFSVHHKYDKNEYIIILHEKY